MPFRPAVAHDVLSAVPRPANLLSSPSRVSYVHSAPHLGAEALVWGWLAGDGLEAHTRWRVHPGAKAPMARPLGLHRPVLVLSGVTVGPAELDLAPLVRRHRQVVLIGTSPAHEWQTAWGAEVITADRLRLTADGVRDVVGHRQLAWTAQAVERLHRQTAGWPMMVDLALSCYRPEDVVDDPELGLREAARHLVSHVGESVPPELAQVYQTLALAGELSVAEVDTLGEGAAAAAANLRRLGLVRDEREGDRLVYRATGVVAAAALATASPEYRRRALAGLARQRMRLGILDHGLGMAQRSGDWPLVCRILDLWWPQIWCTPDTGDLERVVWEIPPEALAANPGTRHWGEYVGLLPLGETPVQLPAVDEIDGVLTRGEPSLLLQRALVAMLARRRRHRYQDAVDLACQGRPLAEATVRVRTSRTAGVSALWFLQAGVTHEITGQLDQARDHYRWGWQARRYDVTGYAGANLAGRLAAHAAWRGDTHEARDWLAAAAELDRCVATGGAGRSSLRQAKALLADDRLDRDASRSHVIGLGRPAKWDESWSWRLVAMVHHRLTWGEAAQAYDEVRAAERRHAHTDEPGSVHGLLVSAVMADVATAMGWGALASRSLREVRGSVVAGALEARLLLLTGDPEAALRAATLSLDRNRWRRHRTQLLLVQAVAAHGLGEEALAEQAIRLAVTQVVAHDDLRALCTVPRQPLEQLAAHSAELAGLLTEVDHLGGSPIYPAHLDVVEISKRQAVVLAHLVRGRSLKETAQELFVSVNTVKSQARTLYRVLGVSDRAGLVAEAVRLGLVPDVDDGEIGDRIG